MTKYVVTRIVREVMTLTIEVPEGADPAECWECVKDDVDGDDWEFICSNEEDEIDTIEEV